MDHIFVPFFSIRFNLFVRTKEGEKKEIAVINIGLGKWEGPNFNEKFSFLAPRKSISLPCVARFRYFYSCEKYYFLLSHRCETFREIDPLFFIF